MTNNTLTMTLLDIATHTLAGIHKQLDNTRGPNFWEQVKNDRSAYGDDYDYEIKRQGRDVIVTPVCNAALQWLYYSCPQDTPRYGGLGFKFSIAEANAVTAAMARDGLVSEDEYVFSINAENQQQLQNGTDR